MTAKTFDTYDARKAELREMTPGDRRDALRRDLMFTLGFLLGSGKPGGAAALRVLMDQAGVTEEGDCTL